MDWVEKLLKSFERYEKQNELRSDLLGTYQVLMIRGVSFREYAFQIRLHMSGALFYT